MSINLGFLNSPNGDKSSKRLLGCLILVMSLVLGLIIAISSLFFDVNNTEAGLNVLESLLLTGWGLLGAGVVDGFSAAKKSKEK